MKECAARRSYMVSSLESVVGRSADLFVLHVPHVIAQADGKKTKQAGQKKHQKLEDVQDLIKIQETKKQFIGSDDRAFCVLSRFPEYLSHSLT